MNYLKALWHELRGHRMTAIPSNSGNGVFIFCYECFNSGKDREPFGYFQHGNLSREHLPWQFADSVQQYREATK
jgi:hypothetical protein